MPVISPSKHALNKSRALFLPNIGVTFSESAMKTDVSNSRLLNFIYPNTP